MAIPKLASYPLPAPDSFPQNKVNWSFDPSRAVLLVHDMQQYFVDFYGEDSPLIAQVKGNIARLRAWCKARDMPVVYTAQPTEQKPEDRGLLNDMWGPGLTTCDPAVQRIVRELAPDGDDAVLTKWRYSAFQRSKLEEMMRHWQRDQLVICGVYAHIGCMTTAQDAFMRDIKPFFVGDALADFSEEEHRWAMRYVATRCGQVVGVAGLTQHGWEQTTRHNTQVPAITRDWLESTLLNFIDEADREVFDADENLIDYGVDSVRVMSMIAEWKKAGIEVSFEDLARKPTLNAWWALIERNRSSAGRALEGA